MRRAPVVLVCCAVLLAIPALGARGGHGGGTRGNSGNGPGGHASGERLLRFGPPSGGRVKVAAPPFVNVIIRLGTTGATADESSFRARLGGVDVTPLFQPMLDQGQLVGMRAALGPALLNVGHGANRLRLDVRGRVGKRRVHDIDRVRFAAVASADRAPIAHALAPTDVLLAGVPAQFNGAQSSDPDDDELGYLWDFGDGSSASDVNPVHVFTDSATDVTVRLTVSDGELEASDQVTLLAVPPVCSGCTAGVLRVEANSQLEFSTVPLGSTGTRTFTIRNLDTTPMSDLHVRLGTGGGAFTVAPTDLDVPGGSSVPVTVTFAPSAAG